MVEGALAEVVGACTSGGVLTAWALYLELPLLLVGVLGALPFTAQLVQLPAAWCTRRFGSRRAALWTIGISRQCVLPLACLPFVPLPASSKQAIFLGCAFTSAALSVAGTNAWTSWMGDLAPGPHGELPVGELLFFQGLNPFLDEKINGVRLVLEASRRISQRLKIDEREYFGSDLFGAAVRIAD